MKREEQHPIDSAINRGLLRIVMTVFVVVSFVLGLISTFVLWVV